MIRPAIAVPSLHYRGHLQHHSNMINVWYRPLVIVCRHESVFKLLRSSVGFDWSISNIGVCFQLG